MPSLSLPYDAPLLDKFVNGLIGFVIGGILLGLSLAYWLALAIGAIYLVLGSGRLLDQILPAPAGTIIAASLFFGLLIYANFRDLPWYRAIPWLTPAFAITEVERSLGREDQSANPNTPHGG